MRMERGGKPRRIDNSTYLGISSNGTSTSGIRLSILPTNKFEHLSFFLLGLLALGVQTLGDELPPGERTPHLAAAEGLAYSCWLMYAEGLHGLAPDEVMFERMERRRMRPGGEWIPAETRAEGGMGLRKDEKWFDAYDKWQMEGAKGSPPGVPVKGVKGMGWGGLAGVGVAQPMRSKSSEKKDYFSLKTKYLLRPEVIILLLNTS